MKKRTRIASLFACLLSTCMTLTPLSVNAAEPLSAMSDDAILLSTGMPAAEVYAMDEDIKEYIVESLIDTGNINEMVYIPSNDINTPVPHGNQTLSGIDFSVSASKSAGTIHIYPTYEFTTPKKPLGNDNFIVEVTDALYILDAGGQVWYQTDYMTDWEVGGDMVPLFDPGFYTIQYPGDQLGTPDGSMLFKGCAYVQAEEGPGSDNRIKLTYVYDPNWFDYDIEISAPLFFGISINPYGDVYVGSYMSKLNY